MGDGGDRFPDVIDVMDSAIQTLQSAVFNPVSQKLNALEIQTVNDLKSANAANVQQLTAKLQQIASLRSRMEARMSSLRHKVNKRLF